MDLLTCSSSFLIPGILQLWGVLFVPSDDIFVVEIRGFLDPFVSLPQLTEGLAHGVRFMLVFPRLFEPSGALRDLSYKLPVVLHVGNNNGLARFAKRFRGHPHHAFAPFNGDPLPRKEAHLVDHGHDFCLFKTVLSDFKIHDAAVIGSVQASTDAYSGSR